MKTFNSQPDDDHQLSKLESHIKNLPQTQAPKTWKTDILSIAQRSIENHSSESASPRINHQTEQSTFFNHCISIFKTGLNLVTPVRVTVATVWLLALCSGKIDKWVHGDSVPSTVWSTDPSTYLMLSDKLTQWELAGLETDDDPIQPNETHSSEEKQPETIPGPRSQRNTNDGKSPHNIEQFSTFAKSNSTFSIYHSKFL